MFEPMASDLNLLGLCGSLRNYTAADVDKAWRRAMLKAHPDKGGSKEQVHKLTEARERLLKALNGEEGIPWADLLNCFECFGKHPDTCSCTCKTYRQDKSRRDFEIFLDEHPEFRDILEEMHSEQRARTEAAEERAKEAEESASIAQSAAVCAERAKAEAEQKAEAATAAMTPEAARKMASAQYYSKIRRELHIGKTVEGTKLTPQMVQERFDKLEQRHSMLAPRYQAADAEVLSQLREKWKEDLTDAARGINEHTTEEIAGVHSRLDHMQAQQERIEARLEGKLPPRRPDQTATQRKREIDEVLPGLRQERKELVAEERAEKAARKQK